MLSVLVIECPRAISGLQKGTDVTKSPARCMYEGEGSAFPILPRMLSVLPQEASKLLSNIYKILQ